MRVSVFPYVLSLFLLILGGCSSGELPPYEITFTDPVIREALKEGFAMAPVDAVEPIPGGTESLAFLTNELYTALLVFTDKTEIVEPGVVLKRMENGGEEFQAFARSFHRSRINKKELSQSDAARIYPHLAQRFLFLAWTREKGETGMRESATDYQDIDYAMDIFDVTFKTFEGELTGEMIDLVTGLVIWRGVARYRTGEMYGDNRPEDLWTRRSSASSALARLLALD